MDLTGVSIAGRVQAVAVGELSASACALVSDGTVQCWGDDDFEELGSIAGPCPDSATGASTCSQTPVEVPGVNDAAAIATGGQFACALSAGGVLSCWGANDMGALGTSVPLGSVSGPVQVATGVAGIAVGHETACGQMADMSWKCWGADLSQVGASGTPPASPQGWDPDIDGAITVGFGGVTFFGCALWPDGSVRCFGILPWSTDTTPVYPPAVVAGLPPLTQMAVGADFVCGVTVAGQTVCWGNNGEDQIGVAASPTPLPPTVVPGVDGAVQVAVGAVLGGFACDLLNDGTVECWGRHFTGIPGSAGLRPVLGDSYACSESNLESDPCSAPVPIGGVLGVTQIAAGVGTCALKADGTVECWGLSI